MQSFHELSKRTKNLFSRTPDNEVAHLLSDEVAANKAYHSLVVGGYRVLKDINAPETRAVVQWHQALTVAMAAMMYRLLRGDQINNGKLHAQKTLHQIRESQWRGDSAEMRDTLSSLAKSTLAQLEDPNNRDPLLALYAEPFRNLESQDRSAATKPTKVRVMPAAARAAVG
jgi:hypothetical protein